VIRSEVGRRRADRSDRSVVEAVQGLVGEAPARWLAAYGVRRFAMEPIDGEHGGAILARMAKEYAEVAAVVCEDGRVGLALQMVDRKALESGQPRRLGTRVEFTRGS
jgi:hypothetical protein